MIETAQTIIKYNVNNSDTVIQTIIQGLIVGLQENKESILEKFIERYDTYVTKLWEREMTKPTEFANGQPFKFIVHNLTKDDFYDEFKTELVSSSLITDKEMCVCGRHQVGFILVPYNIKAAVPYDLYTINDYFLPSFYHKDYKNRNYRKAFNYPSAILPPSVVEEEVIEKNIEENGEILNNDNRKVFSEIIIDGWAPHALYTITNGEKEINPNYVRAQSLNKRYMFDFVDIDKSLYRIQNGLEPLTPTEQIDLARNLFAYTKSSIRDFEELYPKIYKLFLMLKRRGEYSADRFAYEFEKIKKLER